jgi:hypothetical protein
MIIIYIDIFFLFFCLVIYDWFERENRDQEKYHGHQYKLGLTKQQYDQMKSLVSPMGICINYKNK